MIKLEYVRARYYTCSRSMKLQKEAIFLLSNVTNSVAYLGKLRYIFRLNQICIMV